MASMPGEAACHLPLAREIAGWFAAAAIGRERLDRPTQ
jgi:hypothetical protein